MEVCTQCPRACRADRKTGHGFCGVGWNFRVARAALHPWEEPPISGKNGSGTIFFSGCNLRCVFCQNRVISHETLGKEVTPEELAKLMFSLRDAGAANINLVTPTHYAPALAEVLHEVRPTLGIPVVYNCGGYENADTLRVLAGLVDVYLPDFKYSDPALSAAYSGARDYFPVAIDALGEMLRQVGKVRYRADGTLASGVIVRHLVLPGCRNDSIQILRALRDRFGKDVFLLSLMSQYTPEFAKGCGYPNLERRLTTFEYETVRKEAEALGFEGFMQLAGSATAAYTPDFRASVTDVERMLND